MPEDVYYIEINNRRCPGANAYVLEPDSSGDYVRLQEKTAGERRQHWHVTQLLDVSRQFSGVVLYNVDLEQALRFVGKREPLQMSVWYQGMHDPSFAWMLRPSADPDYRDECALMCATPEWGYYIAAEGGEPCAGARVHAWEWRGNDNEMWLLRAVS